MRVISWPLPVPVGTWQQKPIRKIDVTSAEDGSELARDRWGDNKRAYDTSYVIDAGDLTAIETVKDVIDRAGAGQELLWVQEALGTTPMQRVRLGYGDGVSTTFPMNIVGDSDVFVSGDAGAGEYPLSILNSFATANNFDDDTAALIDGVGTLFATNATLNRTPRWSYYGRYSAELIPTADNPSLITARFPVVDGLRYYGLAWVKPELQTLSTLTAKIRWYDIGGGLPPSSTPTAISGWLWQPMVVTGIAPAGAIEARLEITYVGTPPCGWWADCMALSPIADWYLPSLSPRAVELTGAPAANNLVLGAGVGAPIIPVRADIEYEIDSVGNLMIPRFSATESW
jgi:hypothetical protein